MATFNVSLNRKNIDTVFYSISGTRAEQEEYVRKSLIDHDGYDANIKVRLVSRLTADEWELQGNYGHGWECLTTEESRAAARAQKKCYEENEGGNYRIVKRRVRIA
jgi:hypothetical protein